MPLQIQDPQQIEPYREGTLVQLTVNYAPPNSQNWQTPLPGGTRVRWTAPEGSRIDPVGRGEIARWDTTGLRPGLYPITAQLRDDTGVLRDNEPETTENFEVTIRPVSRGDTLAVALQRIGAQPTRDQALWVAIRNRTNAISFGGTRRGAGYQGFIDRVLRQGQNQPNPELTRRRQELPNSPTLGVSAYELLKTATQTFLLMECGVPITIQNNSALDGLNPPVAQVQGQVAQVQGQVAQVQGRDTLFHAQDEQGRLGQAVTRVQLAERLTEYLGSGGNTLPYLNRIIEAAFPVGPLPPDNYEVFNSGILSSRAQGPLLIELIWSYWQEEGMLAQTMSAISRRFQNVRGPGGRDPLAHLEIAPLRPLNSLLWGYIQDEWNRLSVRRRAYEYDHHYGLSIYGKAVPTLRPADSRSKFLEAFHNLLHLSAIFFKEDNDTTVIADGYPLLNSLKEVHLLLAQGAHNQFGDLPWTARVEMLIQQWLLARPEMREFLQSRQMVPYREAWMPQVDTMKTLQGWSDVTVTHYGDLGVYGEQILLSVRYGDWIDVNDENQAKNWARYWRPEIQGYLHAYRAVTGVDLANAETVDYALPTVHLQRRLAMQQAR
jgi:hypothetical protein